MHPTHPHTLAAHVVLRLPERGPVTLRVQRGRLWVTQAGSPQDWFLDAPQSLRLSGRHIVIEAETACEVLVTPVQAPMPWWPWRPAHQAPA